MFGINKTVTIVVASLLGIVCIFSFGYYKGHHSVQVKFDAYKEEVKATAAAQQKQVEEVTAKQKQITKETQDAYKTKLANLRTYYGMQSNGSGSMLKVPNSTAGTNGYPSYTILVGQCAETTLQLSSLQDWVTTQQSVMK